MQFPSVPWNSSEMSVDAAPGHSQHQQLWEGLGSQPWTSPETLGAWKNPSQISGGSMQVWETQHSPSRGSDKGALEKAAAPAVQLSSQGRTAEHMEALHVSLRSSCWQMCSGKRWHQSKLKCSAKISFFFPNRPRTCSNSRGTSTAFFFTSLSKSCKIKTRKYCQNSVQALHPNNTAHSKIWKYPANKHFKHKKPALAPLLLMLLFNSPFSWFALVRGNQVSVAPSPAPRQMNRTWLLHLQSPFLWSQSFTKAQQHYLISWELQEPWYVILHFRQELVQDSSCLGHIWVIMVLERLKKQDKQEIS